MRNKPVIKASCYDRKGRLISSAYNNYNKTHPIQKLFAEKVGHGHRQLLHAEILAIIRAKEKQIHKIKVERYGKKGQPLLAAPCPICMAAIKHYGIAVIEFTL